VAVPTNQLVNSITPDCSDDGLGNASSVLHRHALANDASHFHLVPEEVMRAQDADSVSAMLADAGRRGLSVTFRSGGTSLSGQAVTDSLLADVRRHFQRLQILDNGERVRVQPGVTVRQVNARLFPYGRKLGPDPASEGACTVGGVIANNSSGMSCGVAQNAYNTLESLTVVLTSGTIIDSGASDADHRLRRAEPRLYTGLQAMRDELRSRADHVAELRRLFSMKNTMGYGLNAFLDYDEPSQILAHLLVGSEGTLGFIAEAVLRTVAIPRHSSTGLFIYPDLVAANEALPALVDSGADAIELLDARSLAVACASADANGTPLAELDLRSHAALLVEYGADSTDELDARERATPDAGQATAVLTRDAALRARLWHLRKGLYAAVAGARPPGTMALLEDIAVPVESLTQTCQELTGLFSRYGYEDSVIFGHAKDGNIHFMLTDRFADPEPLARYAAFTEDMVDLVLARQGTLKAEHGTGRVMAPFVERQYGVELYRVMRRIKDLFDPAGILNPATIITNDRQLHLKYIKTAPAVEREVDRCVECGFCEPVCPSKDLTLTPRQRIVIRRAQAQAETIGDQTLVAELDAAYDYQGVQTCAVDGMCQTVCPVKINTGDLVKRLRAARRAPLERVAWTVAGNHWHGGTRAASVALTVAKSVPRLASAASHTARTLLGADRVPLWTTDLPGGGRARGRPSDISSAEVVYFPSCMNSMFGPEDGGLGVHASLDFLTTVAHAPMRMPRGIDRQCCGTPWSSKGHSEAGSAMRERVLEAIRDATEDGRLPVICDATSCTEGLRQQLAEAEIVVLDSTEYAAVHLLPRLPAPRRIGSLVLHPTCSSTRLGIHQHLQTLAQAIAHTVIVADSWGCCAFAGDRGMLHPELTAAATRTQAFELKGLKADAHVSCNRTCELGMTRATGHPYSHILEVLADRVHATLMEVDHR